MLKHFGFIFTLVCQKSKVTKVAQEELAQYSHSSETLQQMKTTAEATEKTFLVIDQENKSISFPFENKDGNLVQGTLTVQNFLKASSEPGEISKEKLQDYFSNENKAIVCFKEFLEVIYKFLQLGF